MRFFPIIGFLALVVLLAALLVLRPDAKHATQSESPLPQLALSPLSGKQVWHQETLKGQVTVLNFFASWCTPCEAEMPELLALKQQFPQLKVWGVAWNDEAATLKAWLTRHGKAFDTVWTDNKGEATIALGIRGIPETIIVDKNGMVRYRLSGPLTPAVRAREVDPLLAELLAAEGQEERRDAR